MTHAPVHVSETGDLSIGDTPVQTVGDQPVLVNFAQSILDREILLTHGATSLVANRRQGRPWWKRLMLGENRITPASAAELVEMVSAQSETPTILIIGGGTVSDGAQILYDAPNLRVVSFDVYASPHTDFVADAHHIPILDQVVDAVWIEAVLEHVLTPAEVVDEIWRVLKPDGIVYAATPFLQPVHERAYDFTRFSESGHRWLFRRFDEIDRGVLAGPGTALFQQLRYAFGAVAGSRRIGSLLAAPFFWLRFIDRLAARDHGSDAASATFFMGRKSERTLSPKDMPALFRGVRK
ncbi:methyltransferase domain-containing protein [Jannaschia aquimarina]|uniref:methyltransferase domain-containing protein n=1 Tax=Jannaschia aquimarina TaxID=935700 RepID=UPI001131C331|nr:class I SAM-dependent methyltransferase [Jannaschia aquimarina]